MSLNRKSSSGKLNRLSYNAENYHQKQIEIIGFQRSISLKAYLLYLSDVYNLTEVFVTINVSVISGIGFSIIKNDLLRYYCLQIVGFLSQFRENFQHVNKTTLVLLPEIRVIFICNLD